MCHMCASKKGFTLIELLVVFAIVGILATIVIVSTAGVRSKARDGKRVFDTQQITTALEAYYARNSAYPTFITFGQTLDDGNKTYLAEVPVNPEPRVDGDCNDKDFHYEVDADNNTYRLTFCLGSDSGRLKKGVNVCTNGTCFSGGELTVKDRDGNSYDTVSIGGQLWLASELMTETKPDGSAISPNHIPYYSWDQAMNGSTTEAAQGMCPNGWHVPSDADWHELELFLTDDGQSCDAARSGAGCETGGEKIGYGGATGFNANYMGYHDGLRVLNSSLANDVAQMWSSSEIGSEAWMRGIAITTPLSGAHVPFPHIDRSTQDKALYLPVRCVID